jgi:hypothetical protein
VEAIAQEANNKAYMIPGEGNLFTDIKKGKVAESYSKKTA